ncbi:MAG: hypothetical protein Q4B87_01645 [Candidatus Saccharibacteria bacterium]|nr:hypothetical protein [Candidatus Saccharibacteria bacterium]
MNNHKKADYARRSRRSKIGYYDYYSVRRVRLHKIKVGLKKLVLFVIVVSAVGAMTYFHSVNNYTTSAQPVQSTEPSGSVK